MNFNRNFNENTPLILRHIAQTKSSKKWLAEESKSIGTGIGPFSKTLAQQICAIDESRRHIENQIVRELERNEYRPYIRAMERLGIKAPKLSASLICAAYPFERFLKDGKPISEYSETANGKRSRRNRSKSSFKLACGLGMVRYQSGDKQGFRPGGSSDARMAIYLWVRMVVVVGAGRKAREPSSEFIREMQDYYRQTEGPGNLKVQRVARRLVDRLFRELVKEFSTERDRASKP